MGSKNTLLLLRVSVGHKYRELASLTVTAMPLRYQRLRLTVSQLLTERVYRATWTPIALDWLLAC